MKRNYGWWTILFALSVLTGLSGCDGFKTETSAPDASIGPTTQNSASPSLQGNATPTSTPSPSPSGVATNSPTQSPTPNETPTEINGNNGNNGAGQEGLGDSTWLDPNYGKIIPAPGYSNPAYSVKKDLRLRIIYLKTSQGETLTQNPQLEAQAVISALNETYTHQGKKGFNFVLDEVKTVTDDANFNLVTISQITSLGDTYSSPQIYTMVFVKKMGASGNINGTSGLFSGLSDKQLIIFAHSNIAIKDAQGKFTGYKVTIDHEVGHMFGMIHTSDPSGASAGSGNGSGNGNGGGAPGFSNENTILASYVGTKAICPKNFNFHVIQSSAVTEKVHGLDYEGYKYFLYPISHYQRVLTKGMQGRTYEKTNMMDCYYQVKLLQNRPNK
ncbi:MAG: hypothetical protein QE271_02195 [Bacteriovoracaceae bacterium]|nr:hypothetical protein [Bacteriovoracaceae bacterium]